MWKCAWPDPEKTIADAVADRVADAVPPVTALAALGYSAVKAAKMLNNERMKKQYPGWREEHGEERGMTRRNFMKFALGGTVAVVSTMNTIGGVVLENGKDIDRESILREFIHASLDYRNAHIAREILRASEGHDEVRVIYGKRHYAGVRAYLERPEDIDAAIASYEKTYGRISSPGTDVYNAEQKDQQ